MITWKYLVSIDDENSNSQEIPEEPRYNYFKGNYPRFKQLCNEFQWDELLMAESDIDKQLDVFVKTVKEFEKETVPHQKTKKKQRNQPWINGKSLKAIKKKHFAWKRFMESKAHIAYTNYIKTRNKATKTLRFRRF